MARAAGIAMPWTMVLRSGRGDAFFAVERFDRRGAGRVHMHTAAGMLDVDFRQPSTDYENLHKLVRWTTRHAGDQDEMFRRMAFNVLAHNHRRRGAPARQEACRGSRAGARDETRSDRRAH